MEHSRGRGLKINGASRPHSRNRKWVAGQDNTGHGSDGERWERGGAARRARGRGRGGGSARGTPHLTVPHVHEEDMNAAEEEGGHSGGDEDDLEAEVEVEVEVENKDPETPEERERFYQELVKAREVERKKAIADGKMDDPLVPKRLDEAITMVGTCMDMCPRFERYRRERENNLDRWEVIPGTKRVDHRRAVKIYERAAGDKTLPSDLRPPPVLKKTLDYLFHDLIPRGGFSQTYSFIRDRSRAVRNDFTMQHETGPLAMECHDRCARFHIIALHLERDNAGFSHALEEQQLMNTLQSLKEFYEDQRGRYSSPTELEMRVYHRLIHIRDQRERHDDIPQEILNNPVFQLTTKFRLVVQEKSAPITKVSRLVVDAAGMSIFAELAGVLRGQNNVVMIYLVACILERLFGKDAIDDIEAIRGELSISEVIDGVSRPVVDAATPPKHHTTIETHVSPPPQANAVTSVFAPVAPPPSSSQSAFSNLASSSSLSSVFGGPTTPSVFGGLTFGIPSSSRSAFPPSTGASQSPFGHTSFPTPPSTQPNPQPALALASSSPFQQTAAPPKSVFGPSSTTTQSAFKPTTSSPLNPGASAFVPSTSFLIPVETQPFPGPATPANVEKTEPISFLSAVPITTSPVAEQPPRVPTPPEIEPPPVNGKLAESRSDSPRPRIVERRQTLWEFPGTPSHLKTPSAESSYNGAPPTPTTPIPVSPNKMPSLGRFEPVALPPTPTARWFEPSSPAQLKLNPSLLLRKQSMGLILQLPDAPAPVEILSPLTLPKTAPQDSLSSTPTRSLENIASTSKLSLDKLSALPSLSSLNKGKEKDKATILDLNSVAHSFLRTSSIVKKHFKLWLKRTIDRAAWDEACRKSEVYSEKVQRHRHSSSVDSSISEMQTVSEVRKRRLSAGVSSSSASARVKRSKHRMSTEYKPPLSDEELARRLKENQEEHQRRWVRGSFLQAVRERVSAATPDGKIPPEWRIWVSANTENDGTAIWLEHKFDIPTSGQWHAENVFSIPVASKGKGPASEGAPGLIVFERTPLGDYPDMIERKYRVLDDCTRLRDALDDIRETKLRFKPSLVVINWSETDGPDAAADFGEMIKELVAEGTVADVTNFVVSAKSTDLDSKFKAALDKMSIDVQDKFISTMSWKRLTEAYLSPFKSFASDWLDSCWVGETLDWSRYGEVIRSLEEAQNMLLEELLALVGGPSGIAIDAPIEFDAPAHMGAAAYATGPFLDACVHLPISRAEEALGSSLRPSYAIPHDELEVSARRFETLLRNTSSHLRQLAAASLSSRARQKRRASDESESGSPSSTNKRARLSLSPASSEVEIVDVDADMDDVVEIRTNGHHAAPPSTAPSDTPARAPVTIAMLRALAQGVLNGAKS